MYIPTLDTGAEVATRFYKELTDIQVSLYNYSMQFVIYVYCSMVELNMNGLLSFSELINIVNALYIYIFLFFFN